LNSIGIEIEIGAGIDIDFDRDIDSDFCNGNYVKYNRNNPEPQTLFSYNAGEEQLNIQ